MAKLPGFDSFDALLDQCGLGDATARHKSNVIDLDVIFARQARPTTAVSVSGPILALGQ